MLTLPFQLPSVYELVLLLLLLIIGTALIILVVKILLFILPAAIIAIVVWLLTGSPFWAGVAFLVVALISLLKR
ncbi:MAG: hypothetical protein ACPLKQ_07725 [Candidatus Bathyarchaeales archaeon]